MLFPWRDYLWLRHWASKISNGSLLSFFRKVIDVFGVVFRNVFIELSQIISEHNAEKYGRIMGKCKGVWKWENIGSHEKIGFPQNSENSKPWNDPKIPANVIRSASHYSTNPIQETTRINPLSWRFGIRAGINVQFGKIRSLRWFFLPQTLPMGLAGKIIHLAKISRVTC